MKNYGVTDPPGITNNVLDKFGMTSAGNVEANIQLDACMVYLPIFKYNKQQPNAGAIYVYIYI